jgi:hypothetical protein
MKVRDLAQKLAQMDQDLEVYCYIEDERFATANRPFFLLDIHAVTIAEGRTSRDPDGTPNVTFEHSADSWRMITLEVTADF